MIKKEAEKILKYKDLTIEIQRMWNVKTKVLFKLSSCIAVCRGRYFPSLSFCFDYSAPSDYRASIVWIVECNSRSL